ncbi:MAG: hypothetical protein KME29_06030 [Calothrix sp. FI2-JRJ7]|jgi:hypothetical protein|nr:hypothetical protein [Calothrix sp. FI2-JRJ7]
MADLNSAPLNVNPNPSYLNSEPLTATTSSLLSKSSFTFRESGISNFKIFEAGDPAKTEVGDAVSYTTNLFDLNNNLVGTKDISFKFVKELGNGQFIADTTEIIYLPDGRIFLQGQINADKLVNTKRQKIDIVGGSGIYEGVKGKEYLTQPDSNVLDVVNITLKLN